MTWEFSLTGLWNLRAYVYYVQTEKSDFCVCAGGYVRCNGDHIVERVRERGRDTESEIESEVFNGGCRRPSSLDS